MTSAPKKKGFAARLPVPGWGLAPPLLVLALAAGVYGLYGFEGILLRDYSIYLYSGQQMAAGVPPYVSVFDHKGPLSPMIAGLGVILAGLFGLDDVNAVRLVFFASGCLAVLTVYLLGGAAFRSRAAGFLSAATFLCFYGYAQPAASGPEPKTPLVFFEAMSLYLMTRKSWFWAGFFGTLAFLVWQPMAVFPFVAFVLAVARPREERYRAGLRVAAGIAVPVLATLGYFYYHGALGAFFGGFYFFNVEHLVRGSGYVVYVVAQAASVVTVTYATALLPITIGLAVIVGLYFRRPYEYRFAPLLLSFPAIVLFSARDFQLSDDFYPFLPYAAVGFGGFLALAARRFEGRLPAALLVAGLLLAPVAWLTRGSLPSSYLFYAVATVGLAALVFVLYRLGDRLGERFGGRRLAVAVFGAALLAVALANTTSAVSAPAADKLTGTTIGLAEQREGARQIEERFGEDARLASINSPQIMVLLHKTNPNPYLWVTAGVDREIEAEVPGGFEGWLESMNEHDIQAVSFFGEGQSLLPSHHLTDEHYDELDAWLQDYQAEKIGPFWLFVKE